MFRVCVCMWVFDFFATQVEMWSRFSGSLPSPDAVRQTRWNRALWHRGPHTGSREKTTGFSFCVIVFRYVAPSRTVSPLPISFLFLSLRSCGSSCAGSRAVPFATAIACDLARCTAVAILRVFSLYFLSHIHTHTFMWHGGLQLFAIFFLYSLVSSPRLDHFANSLPKWLKTSLTKPQSYPACGTTTAERELISSLRHHHHHPPGARQKGRGNWPVINAGGCSRVAKIAKLLPLCQAYSTDSGQEVVT